MLPRRNKRSGGSWAQTTSEGRSIKCCERVTICRQRTSRCSLRQSDRAGHVPRRRFCNFQLVTFDRQRIGCTRHHRRGRTSSRCRRRRQRCGTVVCTDTGIFGSAGLSQSRRAGHRQPLEAGSHRNRGCSASSGVCDSPRQERWVRARRKSSQKHGRGGGVLPVLPRRCGAASGGHTGPC